MQLEHDADNPSSRPLFRSEQGSALILAMITVVVMTMLGLVIMNVLLNSNVQAASSEASVQAELIAQKGLDEILALIKAAVQQANQSELYPTTREKMAAAHTAITNLQNSLSSNSAFTTDVPALRGSYSISLEWSNNYAALSSLPVLNPDYPYVQCVMVTSIGTIPGRGPNHKVTKQMELYVSTINPVFRYPVSAGERLTLNGFPYIVGDVLAQNGLVYSNKAKFIGKPGSNYGKETRLPAIKGFIRVNSAAEGVNIKYLNGDNLSGSNDWSPKYFTKGYFPFEDPAMSLDEAIDIKSYFTGKAELLAAIPANNQYTPITSLDMIGPELGNGTINGHNLVGSTKIVDEWVTISGDLEVRGNLAVINGVLTMQSADDTGAQPKLELIEGSLYIKYEDPDLIAADLAGTIVLNEARQIIIEGNTVLNSGFTLEGNGSIYVKGNLRVLGDINIAGTVYVDGDVDLKGMDSINGGLDKPLIIAASGSFDFSNNNTTGSEQRIRAFLYSEQDMNIYGVLSRIKIYGGIHAKNVTLNAVGGVEGNRQDTSYLSYPYSGESEESFGFTPNQNNLKPEQSLLQIFYDEDLYARILHSFDNLHASPPIRIPTSDKLNIYLKGITYEEAE